MKLRVAAAFGTIVVLGLLVVAFTAVAYADPPVGRGKGAVEHGKGAVGQEKRGAGQEKAPAGRDRVPARPARIVWTSTVLTNTAFLASGGGLGAATTYTATASFTVTAPISSTQLTFRAVPPRLGRNGQVTVDASSLPARLEPGQAYTVNVRLRTPSPARRAHLVSAIVAKQGHREIARPLKISVVTRG